uniref:Putative secreted protein n=1 Tax=Anopheles darlingi TaxID=43151 RepID=A0A2M4DB51_ANODA
MIIMMWVEVVVLVDGSRTLLVSQEEGVEGNSPYTRHSHLYGNAKRVSTENMMVDRDDGILLKATAPPRVVCMWFSSN